MTVGILSIQGDVLEHEQVLSKLGVRSVQIRTIDDLSGITHLIIPGGESTVIGQWLDTTGMGKEIYKRAKAGSLAVFGTCAGAILVARKITGKNVPTALGLIDMTIDRNSYGSQMDSFEALVKVNGLKSPLAVAFIRAPKITATGKKTEVLATYGENPILVRQGKILAATFHPELRGETKLHEMFLKL